MLDNVIYEIFCNISDPVTFLRMLLCSKRLNSIGTEAIRMNKSQVIRLVIEKNERYYALPDKTKHGKYLKFYDEGYEKVERESHYRYGRLHGQEIVYKQSGEILQKGTYVKGAMLGIFETYYSSTILHRRYFMMNGVLVGLYEEWYPDGKLERRSTYGRLCGYDGLCEEWFPNGKEKLICHYVKGKKDGKCMEWDENGTLIKDCTYKDDREITQL